MPWGRLKMLMGSCVSSLTRIGTRGIALSSTSLFWSACAYKKKNQTWGEKANWRLLELGAKQSTGECRQQPQGLVSIQLVADWFGIRSNHGHGLLRMNETSEKKQATSRLGLAIRSGLDPKAAMRLSLHRSPVTLAMTVKSELMEVHGTSPLTPALAYRFCSTLQGSTCPNREGASVWPRMARHPV